MKTSKHMIIKEGLRTLALISGLVLMYLGTLRYPLHCDLSANQHALSSTTISLVEQFSAPLHITLYSENKDVSQMVELLVEQYQAVQPKIKYHWHATNFSEDNKQERELLRLQYKDQEQQIDIQDNGPINEALLTTGLFKLLRKVNQWVVFLQGHDEPSIHGQRHRDFSLWRLSLHNQGLKTQSLDLTQTPIIADNVQLLVLASPKSKYSPQEENIIVNYIAKGGDLLWLVDPTSEKSRTLADLLGVGFLAGTVIDLHGQKLGTPHPAISIVEKYTHLPFSAPSTVMALPFANALIYEPQDVWQTTPILTSDEMSWTEHQISNNKMAFEPEKGEVAGPLTLGISLTRPHPILKDTQQRIAVIGNSRFLSNGAIENYGNLAFGLNLVNWLTHDDSLLHIQQPINQDTLLTMHLPTALAIQYGAPSIALISALLLGYYHVRRRHKSHKMAALLSRSS